MSGNLNLSLIVKMVDGATAPLRRLNTQIEAMQVPVRRFSGEFNRSLQLSGISRMREGLSGIGREVAGLTLKLTAMAAGMGFVFKSQFIDTAAQFETLKVALTTIEGSAEKAQKSLNWIKAFTAKTPLELDGATKAFIMLKNSGIDPMNGSMQAITDANSALGQNQENMIEVSRQLGQAYMKQKLQQEEISVLTERGIPVIALLASAMHKNEKAISDMVGKGKIGRKEIALLIEAMGKKFSGASEAQSRTWSGMMSTLSDTWKNFVNQIMEGGAFDFLKARLDGLIKKLEYFQTAAGQAQVDQWAGQLKQFLVDIESLAGEALQQIKTLADSVGGFGNLAKIALGAVAAIMAGPLLLAITNVGFGLITLASTFAANPVLAAIGLITAAVVLLWKNWDDVVSGFKLGIDDMVNWLSNKLMAAINTVKSAISALGDGFMGIVNGLNPFGASQPLFPSAAPSGPAVSPIKQDTKTDVGGTLNIKIDMENGRVKLGNAKPNNPFMNFDIDTGRIMPGAM